MEGFGDSSRRNECVMGYIFKKVYPIMHLSLKFRDIEKTQMYELQLFYNLLIINVLSSSLPGWIKKL